MVTFLVSLALKKGMMMKKQSRLSVYLVTALLIGTNMLANENISFANQVDPIVDLRAPRSLFEVLHNGINDVYVSFQSALEANANISDISQSAECNINHLSDVYDSMVNTTRNHNVYHDDKEFLQKMIDRITSMIDELENSDNEESSKDAKQSLRSVRISCDSFKAKISF